MNLFGAEEQEKDDLINRLKEHAGAIIQKFLDYWTGTVWGPHAPCRSTVDLFQFCQVVNPFCLQEWDTQTSLASPDAAGLDVEAIDKFLQTNVDKFHGKVITAADKADLLTQFPQYLDEAKQFLVHDLYKNHDRVKDEMKKIQEFWARPTVEQLCPKWRDFAQKLFLYIPFSFLC